MPNVLTINGGSSSIRFAMFEAPFTASRRPTRLLDGKIERIGGTGATLNAALAQGARDTVAIGADKREAIEAMVGWLQRQGPCAVPDAIGHRVVHGMSHFDPERVTPELITELHAIQPYDPEHLPYEIELIETIGRHYPAVPQAVCYDTAFHRDMPAVATQLPIPRRYFADGVRRYGFHGLSYTFLLAELTRLGDPAAIRGRVILAHMGGGASLAAVLDGHCVDTSMGFTPTGGLMMATRTGDLDPGLLSYLVRSGNLGVAQLQTLINHESGLLGVSETSGDVRDLLACEASDVRAREALSLYCYQAGKWFGSFAAVLGGLDTVVFAGGIGENCPAVRARICARLKFLGIELDPARNESNAAVISSDDSAVIVRMIHTDEESVIAEAAWRATRVAAA